MIAEIRQWFQSLTASEQRLLSIGSLLVFLALLWVFVYQPVTRKINEQAVVKNRLQSQFEQMEAWNKNAMPDQSIKQFVIPQGMTFSSWLDQQLQKVKLQQMVSRTEPIDESSLSVWLQGAPFNQVIDWLQDISKNYAVRVDQIDINVVDSDLGLTDIRMRLVK